MTLGPARIAVVVLGAWLLAVPAGRAEQKKMSAGEIRRNLAEGDRLLAAGNAIEARKHYLIVVEAHPDNLPAVLKLAQTSEQIQDWDGAINAYKTVAAGAQGADKAAGHAGLAHAYVNTGQFKEAAEHARQAVELNPSAAPPHATLAYSLVRIGSVPDALASARKAVELAPASAMSHATLGEALLAAGTLPEAEEALRKAIELDARTADAHAALAEIMHRKGDSAGAVAAASKALEINPNLPRAFLVRGKANHARGQALQAQPDLAAGLKGDPGDAAAHVALAQIVRGSSPALAIDSYQKALAIEPGRGAAHLELGELLVKGGDHASARRSLERAVELLPQSAPAHHLLAGVYEKDKNLDRALQEYSRAAELDPTLADAHHARGRLLRDQKKDIAGAVDSFDKAVALSPANAQFLTDLGVVLYDAKQAGRAGEMLQKAVATPDYNNPIGFGVLGLVLKDQQRYGDALGLFDKASAGSAKWWLPRWGAAWSHFGLIKKGCPCGPEDEERVRRIKELYDAMVALGGSDPALEARVDALLKGQKVK